MTKVLKKTLRGCVNRMCHLIRKTKKKKKNAGRDVKERKEKTWWEGWEL